MNKTWLKFLVGISAIIVAGCAAYFSVTGLGVLFAGAALSVMIMAGSLELAKLVAATYLKQEWNNIKGFNKWYLTISVGTLMLITSAGIFGYLSNAFQQQNLELQKVERAISVYENKIKQNESEIARYNIQLTNQQNIRNSQENNISKVIERNGSTSRLTQMVRNADKEVTTISNKINKLIQENNIAADSINAIRNQNLSLEREVGGFRFVAEAFNMELKTVVKFFIFIIVIVFDPLAVALIIAFNGLLIGKKNEEKDEITEPVIEAKDIVAEVSRLRLNDEDLKKLENILLNPTPSLIDTPTPTPTPTLTTTPTPTPTPTESPTPTPTIETGTPTPTPTYLDRISVTARENNFFNVPAEGYTDGPLTEEEISVQNEEFSNLEPIQEKNEEIISIIEPINENNTENDLIEDSENTQELPVESNENTSSEEDEKKNLIEYPQQILDSEISEDLEIEETPLISESTDYSTESKVENLYWEKDDIYPNQVIYDLENNKVIVPISEEEILITSTPTPTPQPLKVISRNVSTRRRKFR